MSAEILYHPALEAETISAIQMVCAVPPPFDIRTPRLLEWGYGLFNPTRAHWLWSAYDRAVCTVFNVWFTVPYCLWWLWGMYRALALPPTKRFVWWVFWRKLAPWTHYGDMWEWLWPDLV